MSEIKRIISEKELMDAVDKINNEMSARYPNYSVKITRWIRLHKKYDSGIIRVFGIYPENLLEKRFENSTTIFCVSSVSYDMGIHNKKGDGQTYPYVHSIKSSWRKEYFLRGGRIFKRYMSRFKRRLLSELKCDMFDILESYDVSEKKIGEEFHLTTINGNTMRVNDINSFLKNGNFAKDPIISSSVKEVYEWTLNSTFTNLKDTKL